MKTFTAWGHEYSGTEQFSRRTGDGPEDGFTLYSLENGEYLAVPWSGGSAAWIADAEGRPAE
jgi:hypothetical protein